MNFLIKTVLAASLLLCVGCNRGPKPRLLAPDPAFSINVIEVPSDWPDDERDWPEDEELAGIQQKIFDEEGAPDYFRLLWFRDGRLATQAELTSRMKSLRNQRGSGDMFEEIDMEWIYVDKGISYRFRGGDATKYNLPDNVRIVTEYGDPQDVKASRDVGGDVTIFQYYADGKVFYFREGTLIREETMPSMGGMITRR